MHQKIDLYEAQGLQVLHHSSPQSLLSHKYPNETLIYHGYIGCAPMYPTVIPYQPYLCMPFLAAYDIYLKIVHSVDKHLRAALNHDTPNWRLLNSCPACFYKLQDEPTLEFDWLVSIDGNNSLKHWNSTIYGTTVCIDSRKARSDYWIGPMAVDKFKGEVKAQGDSSLDDWGDEPIKAKLGSLTCKMFSVFHESSIFIAACHHHFILLACDMIQSGELAKYPLVLINKLLMVYGKNCTCTYDIGCVFSKTLMNSSLCP
ncbi:uncharacterized protein F5147DRAFT_745760 [Suillus discolor]|uniref:Uncharacterized protein n=1 Tax=Suillus discolor TaxID=1912936 RepID=A0A9P7JU62_9AGAM|nr:uncharacterized protein F5147DRAFT_745760 [Suillus discolor]KAG2108470.1 hypothetical protein F5147DRAFT_745760 [Suillus discolor]